MTQKEQRDRIDALLFALFDGDTEAARKWMHEGNMYFFGQTPMAMFKQGDGDSVVNLLRERLGEHLHH